MYITFNKILNIIYRYSSTNVCKYIYVIKITKKFKKKNKTSSCSRSNMLHCLQWEINNFLPNSENEFCFCLSLVGQILVTCPLHNNKNCRCNNQIDLNLCF